MNSAISGLFHNLGLRPVFEDRGWQNATLDPSDRGKFKVPVLRNAGLRNRFMHNGQFASLAAVVEMYDSGGGPFIDNKDPLLAPLNSTMIAIALPEIRSDFGVDHASLGWLISSDNATYIHR